MTPEEAAQLAGTDPDYALRDLYNAIQEGKKTGDFPSWTFYIQVMTPEQAEKQKFNVFDITKVWPHEDFPLIEVGKIVLNKNPSNYFAEVEQLAFNPNNLTPGIGASPDRLLQGRLVAYQDAHRYRLGVNYEQLPVNNRGTKVKYQVKAKFLLEIERVPKQNIKFSLILSSILIFQLKQIKLGTVSVSSFPIKNISSLVFTKTFLFILDIVSSFIETSSYYFLHHQEQN